MECKSGQAIDNFKSGFNCGQSVLVEFCEKYGLDRETALKLSTGIGGGFRSGNICGCASAGVLVVGLKHGHNEADDKASKEDCYAKTQDFLKEFEKLKGSIVCREILGHDVSTIEGRNAALPLFDSVCKNLIGETADLLSKLNY
ncbi:C-GCAxxG-C-C family protein [Clostridium sp.]|uniref:C-GCAxxG-C-C family protein n=1 Tax=Clostridium sp. TaxID=1506 RepID=UPI002FC8B24A